MHELTDLPPNIDPRKMEEQTAGNDRIRTEGTRNLVAAALAAGARRMVAQSIAFAYAPTARALKSEDDPLCDDAPWPWSRSVEALHELEDAVTETEGIEARAALRLLLRARAPATRATATAPREVRKRRFPIVGKGSGVFSFIHVDDAAAATVAAVERGAPGIYNVVDDDPAPMREWLPAYAEAVGAQEAAPRPEVDRPPRRRRVHDADGDRAARRLERAGEARARLGAALPELAAGLPGGARLSVA